MVNIFSQVTVKPIFDVAFLFCFKNKQIKYDLSLITGNSMENLFTRSSQEKIFRGFEIPQYCTNMLMVSLNPLSR